MRQLHYITCCPTDKYFLFQVGAWLANLEELGEIERAHVLLYHPKGRQEHDGWEIMKEMFPKATIKVYEDSALFPLISLYIPIIRPYLMSNYMAQRPELAKEAIFYCDSDILFVEKPKLEDYLQDDVCYLSDTVSYIGSDYIVGKYKQAKQGMQEELKDKNVLKELCSIVGIDEQTALNNNLNSGGAQYLIKDMGAEFWKKVLKDCISIKVHLDDVNKHFFVDGNTGYQSWCADMWSVLYNLWYFKKETKVIKEMDFAWATDPIQKLDNVAILHNAGITNTHDS